MNNDEKNCQYCGETIKAIAIKCKHCKSNIQNVTSSIEPNDAKKQAVNNDNSRLSAKSIILTLLFPILGLSVHFYNNSRKGLDFFGNIKIDCDSKSVVSTVKKIIFKEIKQISKLDGISTEEKQNDYRSCFALLTISKLNIKDVQLQYEVRRADNKKTFTVGVFPLFDYDFDIENLQDEVSDLLINEDGLINQTNQRKSSNQEGQINKNVNNINDERKISDDQQLIFKNLSEKLSRKLSVPLNKIESSLVVDINGDGFKDYFIVINDNSYCGSGGCLNFSYVSKNQYEFTEFDLGNFFSVGLSKNKNGQLPMLFVAVHGSSCEKAGSEPCSGELKWNGKEIIIENYRSD
jgi:hypothetical protein